MEFLTNIFASRDTSDITLSTLPLINESEKTLSPNLTLTNNKSYNDLNETEKIDKVNELFFKISDEMASERVINIVKNYEDATIFDLLRRFTYKKKFLDFLHKIKEFPNDMIFICIKHNACITYIESISHKININYVNENKNTCLWNISDMSYLIKLLSSKKLHFDINHLNSHKNTFVSNVIQYKMHTDIFKKIIDLLITKGFDFNSRMNGFCLLDKVLFCELPVDKILLLLKNIDCNITTPTLWLNMLINKYNTKDLAFILINLIKRSDYKIFLNEIMSKYSVLYESADKDMLLIMSIILHADKDKLIDMITYVNYNGDNILHIASANHLDRTIRFIMKAKEFSKPLLIKNNDGKYPRDLYVDNDMVNLLHVDIKLF
jgi:hypothetical protein